MPVGKSSPAGPVSWLTARVHGARGPILGLFFSNVSDLKLSVVLSKECMFSSSTGSHKVCIEETDVWSQRQMHL